MSNLSDFDAPKTMADWAHSGFGILLAAGAYWFFNLYSSNQSENASQNGSNAKIKDTLRWEELLPLCF